MNIFVSIFLWYVFFTVLTVLATERTVIGAAKLAVIIGGIMWPDYWLIFLLLFLLALIGEKKASETLAIVSFGFSIAVVFTAMPLSIMLKTEIDLNEAAGLWNLIKPYVVTYATLRVALWLKRKEEK